MCPNWQSVNGEAMAVDIVSLLCRRIYRQETPPASQDVVQLQSMKPNREWITLVEFSLTADQLPEGCAVDRVVSSLHGLPLADTCMGRVEQAIRASLLRAAPSGRALSIRIFTPRLDARFAPDAVIAPSGWGFFLVDRTVPGDSEGDSRRIDVFLYAESHPPV